MKSQEAWRLVAEAFDTPATRRAEEEALITMHGLCWAYSQVTGKRGFDLYSDVADLLRASGAPLESGDYLPLPDDNMRAGIAALFAAMTERERSDLLSWYRESGETQ